MDYEKMYKEAVIKMRLFFKKYNGLVISEDGTMYKDLLEIFPDIARLENGQLMEFLADFTKEEPVSGDLSKAASNYADKNKIKFTDNETGEFELCKSIIVYNAFKAGAKWQKEQMMKDVIEITLHTEWDYLIKTLRNKLTGNGNEKLIILKE